MDVENKKSVQHHTNTNRGVAVTQPQQQQQPALGKMSNKQRSVTAVTAGKLSTKSTSTSNIKKIPSLLQQLYLIISASFNI